MSLRSGIVAIVRGVFSSILLSVVGVGVRIIRRCHIRLTRRRTSPLLLLLLLLHDGRVLPRLRVVVPVALSGGIEVLTAGFIVVRLGCGGCFSASRRSRSSRGAIGLGRSNAKRSSKPAGAASRSRSRSPASSSSLSPRTLARQEAEKASWAAELASIQAEQVAAEKRAEDERRAEREKEERARMNRGKSRRQIEMEEKERAREQKEAEEAEQEREFELERERESAEAEALKSKQAEAKAAADAVAAAEEDARDAAIEAQKAAELARESSASELDEDEEEQEQEQDIEFDYFEDVEPVVGTAASVSTIDAETAAAAEEEIEDDYEEDDSSEAAPPLSPTSAARQRKEQLADAITMALLKDLTQDSLRGTVAAAAGKGASASGSASASKSTESGETKERKAAAKELAESAQKELTRRRSLTETPSAAAARAAAPAADEDEYPPDEEIEVEEEISIEGGDEAPQMTTSEFKVNTTSSSSQPSASSNASSAANSMEERELTSALRASASASSSAGTAASATVAPSSTSAAVRSSLPALKPLPSAALEASSYSPTNLSSSSARSNSSTASSSGNSRTSSSHSSPTLSPRDRSGLGGAAMQEKERDDRALQKQRGLELLGRARLTEKVSFDTGNGSSSSSLAFSPSNKQNLLLAEEEKGLLVNSRGSSASSSPVVSPRARSAVMRRDGTFDVSPASTSPTSPSHSLASALANAGTGAGAAAGSHSSLSPPSLLRAYSETSLAFDADALVQSLTEDMILQTQSEVALLFAKRKAKFQQQPSSSSSAAAAAAAAVEMGIETNDAVEEDYENDEFGSGTAQKPPPQQHDLSYSEYDISHEDLLASSSSQPQQAQSKSRVLEFNDAYPPPEETWAEETGHQQPLPLSIPAAADEDYSLDHLSSSSLMDEEKKGDDESKRDSGEDLASLSSLHQKPSPSELKMGAPLMPLISLKPSPLSPSSSPKKKDKDADEYEEEFDEFDEANSSLAGVPKASAPSAPTIITSTPFVKKYLRELIKRAPKAVDIKTAAAAAAAAKKKRNSRRREDDDEEEEDEDDEELHRRLAVDEAGGHSSLSLLPESLFVLLEQSQAYFAADAATDGADASLLPRSFPVSPAGQPPFPLESQQIFHKLLFDLLNECITRYQCYWAGQKFEPWFAHRRVLGTVLATATAFEQEQEQKEQMRVHVKQISLEHGIALSAHHVLPSRSHESLSQLQGRLIEQVVFEVERMRSISSETPSLSRALALASAHALSLSAGNGSGSASSTPNVKIPSVAQSVMDYELKIVARAMDPAKEVATPTPAPVAAPLEGKIVTAGAAANYSSEHEKWSRTRQRQPAPASAAAASALLPSASSSSSAAAPPSLDLSSDPDPSLEWEQLEPRSCVDLVSLLADRLLADLLLSTVSVLRNVEKNRLGAGSSSSASQSSSISKQKLPFMALKKI